MYEKIIGFYIHSKNSMMLEFFNCKVTIVNTTNYELKLEKAINNHGDYNPSPPNVILAGQSINFELQHTNWSPDGTDGSCVYATSNPNKTTDITFSYQCPSGTGTNVSDAIVANTAMARVQMIPNPLPHFGHPVNVQFTVFEN